MRRFILLTIMLLPALAEAGAPIIWAKPYPKVLAKGIMFNGSDTTSTCNAAAAASIRYNAGNFEGCNGSAWETLGASTAGVDTMAAVGSSPSANGASIATTTLTLQPADGTHPGVITSGTQTIGGAKTFSGAITASNLSGTNTGDLTLATVGASPANAGASVSGQVLTLQPADATHGGVVSTGTQTFAGAKTVTDTFVISMPASNVTIFRMAAGVSGSTSGAIRYDILGDGTSNIQGLDAANTVEHDMRIQSDGAQLYLGSGAGKVTLKSYGAGALTTDSGGVVSATSDERLKIILGPYTRTLKDLASIKPITYKWKRNPTDKWSYSGFSAQNIQETIPEAVGITGDGYLTLQDRAILAAVVNALNEVNVRLLALEKNKK